MSEETGAGAPFGPLHRLLRPRSIAVVGGGPWCEAVIEQCRRMGYAGALLAVHRHGEPVAGIASVRTVDALPEVPDATFVGVNAEATIDVVAALARLGAGGAVCFANGFAEAEDDAADENDPRGGAARQRALLAAAGDMPILGPNCYGFVDALDGAALWPDQHGLERVGCGVALVTQSSNLALNLTMQRRGLPIASVVASGNQAQQGFSSIGEALLADPRVSALGLHVEGFGDVRALERLAATAARLGKPIVALKVGRSDAARRATRSHSASLAGSDAGAAALMARLGIVRVDTLAEIVEALKLLHVHHPLVTRPPRAGAADRVHLASLSCSGGEASLVADAAWRASGRDGDGIATELVFPALDAERRRALGDALGPRVALANPLDYDTGIWRDGDALERVFAAMSGPDIDVTLVVLDLPREDRCDARDWERPIAALERAARRSDVRFALVASLAENLPEPLARRLLAAGIAPLAGLDETFAAVRVAAELGARTASLGATHGTDDATDDAAPPRPPLPVLLAPAPRETRLWPERAAKTSLAAHGLVVPDGATATTPADAAAAATELGFPVALKGVGIAHKSDVGAVALALADADAVLAAARAMPADAFLVERMVVEDGVELLVGVVRDDAHGFVLTLGAGGIFAEALADRRSLLLPVEAADVVAALERLRVAPLLAGARGRPPVDRDAIVRAVLAVQAFVVARADTIAELEINPLLCTPDAAIALDALLVAAPGAGAGRRA